MAKFKKMYDEYMEINFDEGKKKEDEEEEENT